MLRPVSQTSRITAYPHPHSVRRHIVSVQQKHLEPAGRAHVGVWRCCYRARVAGARCGREVGALTHAVTVCGRHCSHETDAVGAYVAAAKSGDWEGDLLSIAPVQVGEVELGSLAAI